MYYKERLLAEYLPAEDHESYQSYLETLPVYQERLERDYPAPCETCAVKVNNKIREVNYAAKAATIGRFLEQSQSMKLSKMASGWSFGRTTTLVMWLLRGTGWMSTHIVMILWHISAVLYPIPLSSVHEISGTWNGCVKQTLANSKIAWECYETSTLTLLKLVPWSVLFIFWNYQGLNQTAHPEAKLTGITVFWKLDLLVYCFRLGAWAILAPGGMELSKRAFMATHISFLVVFVLVGDFLLQGE